jgi:hypothetical protein
MAIRDFITPNTALSGVDGRALEWIRSEDSEMS